MKRITSFILSVIILLSCFTLSAFAEKKGDEKALQFNMPVHIGRNCWLGAGVIVLPGVTIGDNTVIGAGSVVTKDIPANVVAVGNPCKVLREINEHDKEFYYKDKRIEY